MTGWSPRSERPLMTSSSASTVPSASHQFTGDLDPATHGRELASVVDEIRVRAR